MGDYCPPASEWRYFVNPEPYLRYVTASLGFAVGALLATFFARWK